MINCDDGSIKITGQADDITVNYLQITDTLIEFQPEIAVAVICKSIPTLNKVITKCDVDKLRVCDYIIDLCTRKGDHND